MGKEDMKLIWGSGSNPCWRAMIAIEEKGFGDIEKKLISFSEKGHKGADVMAKNPRGQVPTFSDGDIIVNESLAICLYLENAYPDNGTKLVPKEKMAQVYQMAIEAQENLQMKIAVKCIYYQWRLPEEQRDEKTLKENFQAAREELQIWDKRLEKSGGDFVCGDKFTLVDVVLFPYVATVKRFGNDLSGFPNLKIYYEKLCKRPSIDKSWPPHWREAELADEKKILKAI
ncbi:glutathione S-transferase A-like isoform X2 [Mizuhopecten yessoensis]|uniref:Glutathione S-transferase A n=1 Tax=Mizuhopecten yessoensis TaxID=6573 RepID=A0A210PUG1_MIZYE|nr:glutathione S-transferase A-like isoform X2 [Mizuhopecten yessoensis]OWF40141.1 Glutathione S-transferase A [Mizuhopecten yessoensis]